MAGPCDTGLCAAVLAELMTAQAGMVAVEMDALSPFVVANHLDRACRLLDPLGRGDPVELRALARKWRTASIDLVLTTLIDRHLLNEMIEELRPGWLNS